MGRLDTAIELTEKEINESKVIQEPAPSIIVEERKGKATYLRYSLSDSHTNTTSPSQSTQGQPGERKYGTVSEVNDWLAVIDAKGNELLINPQWSWERKREDWVELLLRCGGSIRISDHPDFIPTKVALLGKPAIAEYLYVVFSLSYHEIGKRLDVDTRTVGQYRTDFLGGRR